MHEFCSHFQVELRNVNTGDLAVFKFNTWVSKDKPSAHAPAIVNGKLQVKGRHAYVHVNFMTLITEHSCQVSSICH